MKKVTCCKDCPDRFPACHDTCERYAEQKRVLLKQHNDYQEYMFKRFGYTKLNCYNNKRKRKRGCR